MKLIRKYLLRYYCMNGLKKLLNQSNILMEKASKHYETVLFVKIIKAWQMSTRESMSIKIQLADNFNQKRMLKTYFNGMKNFKQSLQIEAAKANRFYKYHVKTKLFDAWRIYTRQEKNKAVEYNQLVEEHNRSRLLSKYFQVWKTYPADMKRLKERQKRLDELREKVKQMIPDYEGPTQIS
jgi:hypothetical protein